MIANLQAITWQSMDDVLETRNVNGHLKANILFTEDTPTVDQMDGFKRVLCFVKGNMRGGMSNIGRTEVFLTEDNHYSEVHHAGNIGGDYEVVGLEAERVRFSVDTDGITLSKSPTLTVPGTYNTVFAFVGEDWAEVFVVQIIVTVPLSVRLGTSTLTVRHGERLVIDIPAPYSPQYLRVFGSRPWTLEGVESENVSVFPLSGAGYDNTWDYTQIAINKPLALVVEEVITTAFRIVTQTHWVDVVINFHPPITLHFVHPREGESGAPEGTNPAYIYI